MSEAEFSRFFDEDILLVINRPNELYIKVDNSGNGKNL